jgi:crotonobetaine/carnitine-CoA ligase
MKEPECPAYASPEYPQTYGELTDWAIRRVKGPDKKIFFRMSDTEITYLEFGRNVNKVSNLFNEVGVQKGDHVAVFLSSCLEYAYLYHALGKCGAVMCPINPFIKGEPLQYILEHSDSKYLITSKHFFSDKISKFISRLDGLKCVFFIDTIVDAKGVDGVLFSDYANYPSDFELRWQVSGDDIQGIWYTSGTTGVPKGAVINHKSYMYRILFFANYFRLSGNDVLYYILPMYHVGYAVWGGPLAMAAGAKIVQVPWFSASKFWKEVMCHKATITFSTGTVIPILLNQPVTTDEITGREQLRVWIGWPVDDPKTVSERWPNIRFMEAYGTTEAPVAAIADYDNPQFGNAGPPTTYTNLKIVDPESGEEVPPRKVGEIVYGHKLGADYILREYYKDPEKTQEMIKDGFWHSGDLGMLDEEGRLKFADRLKDYLRVGGENVSSSVVEGVIRKHDSVMEVAVTGRKGELGHDEIVAHVVPKEGATIDPKEFFEFCNENMAYFMVPRYLVVCPELPKTGTLRIEKYKLREEGIPSDAVDRNKLGIVLKR